MNYRVRAERWKNYWTLYISDESGAEVGVTQARHLGDEAVEMVRDYVSLLHDIPAEAVGEVHIRVALDAEVEQERAQAARLAIEARDAQEAASAAARRLVQRLCKDHGLTYADAAAYLGLSKARVGQLAKEA